MEANKRIAVVTGGNKAIGLEICKKLASNGVNVILTARDEKRGKEAVERLSIDYGLTNITFHQLDVTDPSSIETLAVFVKTKCGKLDILVNNAAIGGFELSKPIDEKKLNNEKLRNELKDIDNLTVERINNLAKSFLESVKDNTVEKIQWTDRFHAYSISKILMNAYTRIIAKSYPSVTINCVNPGYVKTDLNFNTGALTVSDGAEGPAMVALGEGGPTGQFYDRTQISFF
ncbi:NAD(P)-binding Rossmann-fold superfamily protein [Rhynchospora pubera]|uniref:NAD(P)-binding Rossmann-fold superfamily protein n=1 Tax=Rhynchospora pubera TaxID=906938 RepID=A0AAV8H2N1_9POAL|nr:NAD(P)-binding Rossmann-fold superfamily protein [Rhynchospora pubera]